MRTEMNKPAGGLGTKRLLAAIAVLAVALAVFAAVPAAEDSDAAGSTVYVDSTIDADDASNSTYKTLTAALNAVAEKGTIILKSDLDASEATTGLSYSPNTVISLSVSKAVAIDKSVTIKSADGEKYTIPFALGVKYTSGKGLDSVALENIIIKPAKGDNGFSAHTDSGLVTKVTITGCEFQITPCDAKDFKGGMSGQVAAVYGYQTANFEITGTDFTIADGPGNGYTTAVMSWNKDVTVTGCNVTGYSKFLNIDAATSLTVTGNHAYNMLGPIKNASGQYKNGTFIQLANTGGATQTGEIVVTGNEINDSDADFKGIATYPLAEKNNEGKDNTPTKLTKFTTDMDVVFKGIVTIEDVSIGGNIELYEENDIPAKVTIANNGSLTVAAGKTLTADASSTITNNGILFNNGTVKMDEGSTYSGTSGTFVAGAGSTATILVSKDSTLNAKGTGIVNGSAPAGEDANKADLSDVTGVTVAQVNGYLNAKMDVILPITDGLTITKDDKIIVVPGSSLTGTVKFDEKNSVAFDKAKGDFQVSAGSIYVNGKIEEGTITATGGNFYITGTVTGEVKLVKESGNLYLGAKGETLTIASGAQLTLSGHGIAVKGDVNLYGALTSDAKITLDVSTYEIIKNVEYFTPSFKAYSGAQISKVEVTGSGEIDLSQAQNPQTVSEDISHDKTYGQLENVTVVDSLTIRNNSKVTIMGQFNIDEGVTLTIEEGSQLIIGGTAFVKIEGNLVIEENATVTQNGGKVSVYGNAEIAGEYSVKGGSLVAEQDSVITVEETGKIGTHYGWPMISLIVKESALLEVEGVITGIEGEWESKGLITNYGTVVFDSQIPAHSDVVIVPMIDGATVNVKNYVIGYDLIKKDNSESVLSSSLCIWETSYIYSADGETLKWNGKDVLTGEHDNHVYLYSNINGQWYMDGEGNTMTFSNITFTGRVFSEPSDDISSQAYCDGRIYKKMIEITGSISSSCVSKDGNPVDHKLVIELQCPQGVLIPETDDGTALTIGQNVEFKNNRTDVENTKLFVRGTVDATSADAKFSNNAIIYVSGDGSVKTLDRITDGTVNAVMFETKNGTETVYNYTTLKTAVDSGAKDITVLGTVKVDESISIPKDTTVKGDGTIVIGSSENTDVELVFADGAVAKTVMFDVDGTLYFENKKDNKSSNIQSDVSVIGEKDARYTNVYTALAKANAGDTVTVSGDTVDLKKNITIKEGVTLDVPYEKHLKVYSGVTVTVNGTLRTVEEIGTEQYTDDGETKNVKFDLAASKLDHTAAIVVNGVFMSGVQFTYGDNEKSLPVYRIPGAYYYQVDSVGEFYYATTLENASKNAAADVEDIEVYGKVAAGDVAFTGTDSLSKDITVTDGAELTVASITLDKATLNVEGMITGDIKAGGSAVTVENVKTHIYVDKDGVYTVESVDEPKPSSGEEAFFKVSAGSVYIQNADMEVTVLAGATLVSGKETARIAALTIEGTVAVANGQTITVDYGVIVMGTLSIAAATDSEAAGTFDTPELLVGVDIDDLVETGDAASVSGAIDKVQVAVVKADATVSEATVDSFKDANGVLKSTTYVVEDNDWIVVYDKTGEFQIGYIEKAPVENAKFTGKWLNTDGDVANGELVGASKCDKVTADVEYDIYTIRINVDAGLESIAIDGNLMLKDFETGMYTMDVKAGTHDITCKLANGYSGDAKFSLVKSVASDDGKIDASVSGNKVTVSGDEGTVYVQITGITSSGYTPAPVKPAQDDKDDGLSLTDILLIILVVLIVVMAIIVALRLMRS